MTKERVQKEGNPVNSKVKIEMNSYLVKVIADSK